MIYKKIIKSIYNTADEKGIDVRDLIRQWCYLFEYSRVTDWDRDLFLCECANEKVRRNKNDD